MKNRILFNIVEQFKRMSYKLFFKLTIVTLILWAFTTFARFFITVDFPATLLSALSLSFLILSFVSMGMVVFKMRQTNNNSNII